MEPKKMNGEAIIMLLIEDNPDHAELVIRSFQAQRIVNKLYHVPDGEAALDYLFQRGIYADPNSSPLPHLILLDLRLPKIDGMEVLNTIKSNEALRRIPVVVLTTSEDGKDVTGAYDRNVNSYLVKPIDFDKFSQMMSDLGFYWLGWNHNPWT